MNASELIGTRHVPPYLALVREEARRAKAYHACCPYPRFAFKQWKEEDRGPHPKCLPHSRHIVQRAARWLFGRPIGFGTSDPAHAEIAERCEQIWSANKMPARMRAQAETAAQTGGVLVKFSWDQDRPEPWRLDCLDIAEHCRLYFDPHDATKLLMLRIQYPFWDPGTGDWFWHREDWTAEEHAVYRPERSAEMAGGATPYDYVDKVDREGTWQIESRDPNPMGLIPAVAIKHIDNGDVHGFGELWGLWHVVDQINFTFDLAHKDNQMSVWPQTIYIDGQVPESTGAVPLAPNSVVEVESVHEKHQAKVELLERASGSMRDAARQHAEDLLDMLYASAGSVRFRAEDVTNKGALTTGVLLQLYQPLIESTEEKRKSYGESGLAVLFEAIARAAANLGIDDPIACKDPSLDVQVLWPSYFELMEDERMTRVQRYQVMVENDFLPWERAATELLALEGVDDPNDALEQLRTQHEARLKQEQANPPTGAKRGEEPNEQ